MVWNDKLASLAMAGVETAEDAFRSEHSSASSGDDLAGIADTSLTVTSVNNNNIGLT